MMSKPIAIARLLAVFTLAAGGSIGGMFPREAPAQAIPHAQDRPPGPPLSPEEALRAMKVPDGFRVELVASEPDIVNPVSMTFDSKGRIWITESLEYPRRDAGPGRDRIKVLEDTDGDRKADRFTVFAEGLNIPCGIAIGEGGVFVTNSPDILYLPDSDGDLRADQKEAVLTGFGRHDTHELPSTLTWGPDGWLYGLNGVFNGARVVQKGREHRFDAALWRYHPRTRDFELFAQGTSNPWGLAFDYEGSAFVSACVIDHLYHLAETGYYHRQAGQYPPHTWKIESVVDHQHQKAAYCGLALYDAEVYPERYRGRLFMGNIHGNAINVDRLERAGSTYLARGEPDFLNANDVWFMPVSVKLGPDGCLYVLDWYDRYHCYQDANRDPQGIDRLKGRLYRIAYGESPPAGPFDLAVLGYEELVQNLASANLWVRNESQRILSERLARSGSPAIAGKLREVVISGSASRKTRLHALWTLLSAEDPGREPRFIEAQFHREVLAHADPGIRAWGVRAAGTLRKVDPEITKRVSELARDPHPDPRLQTAIAARKLLDDGRALEVLLETLAASRGDSLIPPIVWRNLEPLIETRGADLTAWLERKEAGEARGTGPLLGRPLLGRPLLGRPLLERPLLERIVERLLASRDRDLSAVIALSGGVISRRAESPGEAGGVIGVLGKAMTSGVLEGEAINRLRAGLAEPVGKVLAAGAKDPLYFQALRLAAAWRDPAALGEALRLFADPGAPREGRALALEALVASRDPELLIPAVRTVLASQSGAPEELPEDLLREVLLGLGRLEAVEVAPLVLESLEKIPPSHRPQAIDLLTQRPSWAAALLEAVDRKRVDRSSLNLNQVKRILSLNDQALRERVTRVWGQVRAERNPDREKVIARMRKVAAGPGDPLNGKAVYEKTCSQCHVIFGKGQTVGPDLTANGRETLDAILSNLLDPNLVIGKDYYAWTLLDRSGRVLNGLLVEDSPERVVLKVAGGKEEVVPRKEIRSLQVAEISLMPEDLEKTLKEDEFRDLVAFLRLEKELPEPASRTPVEESLPVALVKLGPERGRRMAVIEEKGVVAVSAIVPDGTVKLLDYDHSKDGRPFIHPLRAPGNGPVLTALRPEDHPWQYGVFTGHASAGEIDFWHEKGWIRSRGLESVKEHPDRVEISSRSDWLTRRQGGKRILVEKQGITVHAIGQDPDRYRIDFEWQLIPDKELTLGRYDYGGLAFRPAKHEDRRHARAEGEDGHAWQDMSGLFGPEGARPEGERPQGERGPCGVAIFDHPANPGFPNRWRVDGEGLINPAITARGPLVLPAGKPTVFRYRLLVHRGHGDPKALEDEFRAWAEGGSR